MKRIIESRSGIRPRYHLPLIACAAVLLAVEARADNVAKGSKLPWTAAIPSGWVGGTAAEIEEMLGSGGTDAASQRLDKVLRPMVPEARNIDALFFHLDVEGAGTKTVSSLRINVVGLNLEPFAQEEHRKSFWNDFSKQLAKDFPEGAKVELIDERVGKTAARNAYRGIFLNTLPDGGKIYTVLHMVEYAPGKTHVFRLRADGVKFPARIVDLNKIVQTLKYRSE